MNATRLRTPLLSGTSLEEEIALETQSVEDGVRRYRETNRKAIARGEGAGIKPAERLLVHWFDVLQMVFANERDECIAGKPGPKRHIIGPLLTANEETGSDIPLIGHEQLAVIAMHETLSACMATPSGVRRASLVCSLGRAALAEVNIRLCRGDRRNIIEEFDRRFRRRTSKRVNWWAKKKLGDDAAQSVLAQAEVGGFLLRVIMEHASTADYDYKRYRESIRPAFIEEKRREGAKTPSYIRLSDEAWDIMEEDESVRARIRPRYLPMIVPPCAWAIDDEGKTIEGGYVRIRTPFTSKPKASQKRALATANLSEVYDCLNAVCMTGWRIRSRIRAVQDAIWKSGGGTLLIPRSDPIPMPPRVASDSPELVKRAKRERAEIWKKNVADRSYREEYVRKVRIAEMFATRTAIYYPHQLDFRGRAYPIPSHLHHQSDDIARGMLEFAEPRPITDEGRYWLMVHAANCYGFNSLTYDERVEWCRDNMRAILASAADPLDTDFWRRADESEPGKHNGSPWQFLAACMAIADPEIAAHQPVQMDGRCNGLQHYSALGRDPIGAAAVNLSPSDRPSSVYAMIAASVKKAVDADATFSQEVFKVKSYKDGKAVGERTIPLREIAARVSPLVSAKVVKQPVMTSVYGVTFIGARDQIKGKLERLGLEGQELRVCSSYLAQKTLRGIGEVCAGARAIMDWLVQCAKLIAEFGNPVSWTTPLGLPVVQPYRKYARFKINTVAGFVTLPKDDDSVPIAVGEQKDGVAPNFVHSLDSTHMLMVARACRNASVTFAAIHDGYLTHPSDWPRMARIIREQFVALHRQPILAITAEQFSRFPPHDALPPPPSSGTFDIHSVLSSDYCFG